MRRINHFRAAGIMAVLFLMCTFPSYGNETATPSNADSLVSDGHIHDLVTEETEATCLLNGSRIVTCQLCKDYREEIILPMLGHCDENGDFLCDRCGVVLELFQKGEKQTVKTELPGEWEEMTFTCIDEDYKGGQLFLADQVIPYALCSGFGSGTGYDTSGVRAWLNLQFADGLSVSDQILPTRLSEGNDSINDRVFCLSLAEVRSEPYKTYTLGNWEPEAGNRFYWTRTMSSGNHAYLVQYNGHIAAEQTTTMEAGIRPAYVLKKPGMDNTQDRLWYTGDVQERSIAGITYTFRCIDPDYMDAAKRRGALFLCDEVIGGDQSVYDTKNNNWGSSGLRLWLNNNLENAENLMDTVTTVRYSYSGSTTSYEAALNRFTKAAVRTGDSVDKLFCLSLEEAIRYQDSLWKLHGADHNNYVNAGTYTMGYWLRTPVTGGNRAYQVSWDGRILAGEVSSQSIGFRPAFVAYQSE